MTVATCGQEGPWAAAVFYVHDKDFSLYFLSDPGTRHGGNMATDTRVAATIHQDGQDWRHIKGIQMVGNASLVEDLAEELRAWQLYLARFPFVSSFIREPGVFLAHYAATMGRVRFFRLSPTRIWLTDNDRQFGRRQVFDVQARVAVSNE